MIGIHQAENCSLALACLSILSKRDNIEINETKLRGALEKITIPGRLEIRKIGAPPASLREQAHLRSVAGGQTLIIDGAHNPQKMKTLSNNLAKIYPSQKFTFVIAFKKGKDFKVMLKYIIPLADKILLTQFSTSGMDNHWSSIDNQEIATFLQSQNFKNFSIIKNKRSDILKNIRTSKEPVVITGSLYLISSIYPFLKI
ncbi:MAG: FolC bifunctional protein [Candidatus Moranbacteria bacterium GW2011_GWD2_36_198]|nr:MAG: FolC bifunctional protein [Candidatus Moranbacteria bacterium GW2011_GWD2_36_198]